MTQVMKYFGMRAGEFRIEWEKLTAGDKAQLIDGVCSGTLTY